MYLLDKHINHKCCCIRIGSDIENSYQFRVLERKLLKSFVNTPKKTDYIFDLRRLKKFDKTHIEEINRVINYLALKPPKLLIILGRIEVPKAILIPISNLSQKYGSKLIYGDNLKKLSTALLKERDSELILALIKDRVIYEIDDIHDRSKTLNIDSEDYTGFFQNKKVELFFDSETAPYSREARVYQCNDKRKRILITQTNPPTKINESTNILLTTISENMAGEVIRIAYKCKILKVIKDYKVGDSIIKNALLIDFYPPKEVVNLRTSYRHQLNSLYKVESTITLSGKNFFSNIHFEIDDISVTGIGIKIPETNVKDSGFKTSIGDSGKIVINLIEPTRNRDKPKKTKLETSIEIVRKSSMDKNTKNVGIRFCDIDKNYEISINRFINSAQSYDLRKKQRSL